MTARFCLRRLSIALSIVLAGWVVGVNAQAACVERVERVGEARVTIREPDPGRCWLSLDPEFPQDLRYRSYLMDERGLIMVFNSFGPGPDAETTGAREFYLFPRRAPVDYRLDGESIVVTLPSGIELIHDSRTLRWTGAHGARITEANELRTDNGGGVEVSIDSGLMLDFGFKMGSAPTGARSGRAVFVDSRGVRCAVRNSEVLTWDQDGESSIKFATDAKLFAFARKRCPKLAF